MSALSSAYIDGETIVLSIIDITRLQTTSKSIVVRLKRVGELIPPSGVPTGTSTTLDIASPIFVVTFLPVKKLSRSLMVFSPTPILRSFGIKTDFWTRLKAAERSKTNRLTLYPRSL